MRADRGTNGFARRGRGLPIFGLSKAFGVGRGIKVFLNLQAGATRGEVPNPWHRNPSKALNKKDRQLKHNQQLIRSMRSSLKQHRMELFRLRNELQAMDGLAEDDPDSAPGSRTMALEIGSLPDFVIIGAQKCGTTRLYNVLTRHPDVEAAAVNEVHYFDRKTNFEQGIEWYRNFFLKPDQENKRRTITGEKTPSYLFYEEVPERMAQVMPEVRLIAMLRNPVDRAYSHYHHVTRSERETRSFEEAVDEEQACLADGGDGISRRKRPATPSRGMQQPGLLARGIYVDQLARWREFYGEEQMLVVKSEDFFKSTTEILEEVQDFLGLPRQELEGSVRRTRPRRYEPMNPAMRRRLEAFFEPHNRRLYDYLGRDFGW